MLFVRTHLQMSLLMAAGPDIRLLLMIFDIELIIRNS
jgi:hypothetical protein